ncbi:MAG: carbohydrate porin [Rhodothermales bacterium]
MRYCLILLPGLLAWFSFPVMATESLISPGVEEKEAADSIDSTLERRDALDYDPSRPSLIPPFFEKFRARREEMQKKFRLETVYSYDALGQGYANSKGTLGASSGEVSFSARWLLFGQKYNRPFYLSFRLRDRHAYSDHAPSEISSATGLLWKTVDGFSDAGLQVPNFYFSQELADARLTLRYGQYSIDYFFDKHDLRSAKRYFLNYAFSNNPAVAFPGFGAGIIAQWKDAGNWDITIGASNIQGTDPTKKVNLTLDSSALFYSVQGGYGFKGIANQNARVQLMGWETRSNGEERLSEGRGVSLVLEQKGISERDHFVARYAFSDGDATDVDQLLMLGWGREIKKHDHLGIGLGLGRSALDSSTWQGVGEIYYRWQATKELMITPDLQIILGEGLGDGSSFQVVAGVRAGITF